MSCNCECECCQEYNILVSKHDELLKCQCICDCCYDINIYSRMHMIEGKNIKGITGNSGNYMDVYKMLEERTSSINDIDKIYHNPQNNYGELVLLVIKIIIITVIITKLISKSNEL